jgi:hypothetical protein
MRKLWKYMLDSEPVALFTMLGSIVPLITNGLVVFNAWSPSADQLAYTNGVVVALSAIIAGSTARTQVTPA